MPIAAACSQTIESDQALDAVCRETAEQLGGAAPDLTLLFVSRSHDEQFARIVAEAARLTRSRHTLACTAESIVAGDREIEQAPALSLWSAVLPGAELDSFHVQFERTPDGPVCSGFPEPAADPSQVNAVFLLADPFSCAMDAFRDRMADEFPGVPLLGGMSSGGTGPGEYKLGWNGRQLQSGAIGVTVRGGPRIESIVSQGCRPIGSTFLVTKAEANVVLELGGRPALARLEETYAALPEEDRRLIRQGLHLGMVIDEYKPAFARGDFLIANVLGADRESGAIALGNLVRVGQTVQFHVRDAATADEDLRHLVSDQMASRQSPPGGALLFTCNGRGTRMFPKPHHDAGVLSELCGPIPVAGFFAQGELGPIGGRNYMHGFTACIALFDGESQ
ncbi:MAG: FIST N-terminal domain-containing protein [Planctomycetales bacterium]